MRGQVILRVMAEALSVTCSGSAASRAAPASTPARHTRRTGVLRIRASA